MHTKYLLGNTVTRGSWDGDFGRRRALDSSAEYFLLHLTLIGSHGLINKDIRRKTQLLVEARTGISDDAGLGIGVRSTLYSTLLW